MPLVTTSPGLPYFKKFFFFILTQSRNKKIETHSIRHKHDYRMNENLINKFSENPLEFF